MAPRRGDTRERIQRTALELFTEQGYERTSLREIAERIGVTKAALYYHFSSKEEILGSLVSDASQSLADLTEWTRSQPQGARTRVATLLRLADLVQGRWQPLLRLAEENRAALRGLEDVGREVRERIRDLYGLFDDETADVAGRLRARLAIVAVVGGSLRDPGELGATREEMQAAILQVAGELLGDGAAGGGG